MLCRFCQIVDFTKSTSKMSILENQHTNLSLICKIVDFIKSAYFIR